MADEILLPLPPPTPDELLVHALDQMGAAYGPRGEVLALSGLSFELGRPFVTLSSAQPLDALIAVLGRYPQTDLVIEGYTDSRGSKVRNVLLSLERADAVRDMLVRRGVQQSRLLTRGMGPVDPIASNATPGGRAQNRRIELVFSDSEGNFALAANESSAS
jgi:OmpA-OmpF porin, OOP family